MTQNQQYRVIFYTVVAAICIAILAPNVLQDKTPTWWPVSKLNLGLDLKGGSYMVLGVQTDEAVRSQLGQMAVSIHADQKKNGVIRVKPISTREIEVTVLGNRGASEVESYIRDKYRSLEVGDSTVEGSKTKIIYRIKEAQALQIKHDSVSQAIERVRQRVDYYGVAEPTIQRSGEDHIIVQLPNVTDLKAVKKTIGSVAKLEFRLVYDQARTSPEISPIKFPQKGGGDIMLEDDVLMTGDAVDDAAVEINPQNNQVEVTFRLTSVGGETFGRVTGANTNRQLAIVLDKVVQSSPRINEPITGGSGIIHGDFTKEEARQLAIVLRSGALPAPLDFLEERTVGASLGYDSIQKGLMATLLGTAMVVVFMAVYYGKAGILANACVILNALMLLAILGLFRATLTLPGIAGLALTIGMAVDANVIIFERIRDEIRAGATGAAAIAAGFHKAHWTILDANLTTLLTGIVLYAFGTGPIRGFAVTLSVGIITTLITALYVSKLGFEVLNLRNRKGNLSI